VRGQIKQKAGDKDDSLAEVIESSFLLVCSYYECWINFTLTENNQKHVLMIIIQLK